MENILNKIKENKVEVIFAGIILVILLFLTVDFSETKPKDNNEEEVTEKETEAVKEVKVDVKGAVNSPGVYTLKSDKRVIDAINAAGGLTSEADTSLINLSKKLSDEMVIMIYTKAEMEAQDMICPPCECPELSDACIETNTESTSESSSDSSSTSEKEESSQKESDPNKKVSINTGTLEELQTLDGIGETKAKAIIGYRETNGLFKKIEEIKNVSGIGDSTYEKIKDRITL